MSLIDIKSMYPEEIKSEFSDLPSYRAAQIYKWLHIGIESFDEMTNIPKDLISHLTHKYYIADAKIEKRLESSIDDTVKYLFRLNDSEFVESVLMKYHHGYSICISSQVGCKMGCKFCATGKSGFSRNLTASEMLAQITSAQKDLSEKQKASNSELSPKARISNVVLMGMGEPLDNYDNVIRFLRLVSSNEGLNIGVRHISVSTCGIVDKINKLSEEGLGVTLSVSLHAPNDEIRNYLMPVNKVWNIKSLIDACKEYYRKTGRRISFEYTMIQGVNDTKSCALELSRLLFGTMSHVNLIPVNDVSGNGYKSTDRLKINKFMDILKRNGVTVTVRRTLGSDINASCGQLRRNKIQNDKLSFE